jgi:transposase InsO family protein
MSAGKLSVRAMCRLVGVSRASFYRYLEHGAEGADCELREAVEQVALAWPAYGSRRITAELRRRGCMVNRKRVQRIMRDGGLLCLREPTSWLATTESKHKLPVFPNLTAGLEVTRINQLWVADITYIRLRQEFVFLAAILDSFSRRVIGWGLERHMEAGLCLTALKKAVQQRSITEPLIHHSDRGTQYCSHEYVETLARHGIRGSMSRKGNPYDNAVAERFWRTLKYEQVYRNEYATLDEARRDIGPFIDRIYNRERLHSALDYRTPVEFEAAALGRATL